MRLRAHIWYIEVFSGFVFTNQVCPSSWLESGLKRIAKRPVEEKKEKKKTDKDN